MNIYNKRSKCFVSEFSKSENNVFFLGEVQVDNTLRSITGDGLNISVNKCVLAGIGELLERKNMILHSESFLGKNLLVKGISLKTHEIKEFFVKDNIFRDSTGCSVHMDSKRCIENAFNEFIERQSFVFNYLSKSAGMKVEKDMFQNFYDIPIELQGIKFYNISIISGYYVIFSICKKKEEVWLGLGASNQFEKALKGSIKEIKQFQLKRKCLGKKEEKKKETYSDYSEIYDNLLPEEIGKAYDYLNKSGKMKFSDIISPVLTNKEIIEKLYNECEMEPYLFYTNIDKHGFEKHIKIIAPNWFLSLLPDYDESTYNFVERKMNVVLDRECTFIPFP